MAKKVMAIVIAESDIPKVRKKFAPKVQVVKDKSKYTRRQKHKKPHLDSPDGAFYFGAFSV